MSEGVTQLLAALSRAAQEAAKTDATPVSVSFDWVGDGPAVGEPRATVTRVTRTLVFAQADLVANGRVSLAASAVYRVG